MFAEAVPGVADAYIQYGCFGLLALLVVWTMWKGLPGMLDAHSKMMTAMTGDHKAAVMQLVETFETDVAECRKERVDQSRWYESEREKDRQSRHESNDKMQECLNRIYAAETVRRSP